MPKAGYAARAHRRRRASRAGARSALRARAVARCRARCSQSRAILRRTSPTWWSASAATRRARWCWPRRSRGLPTAIHEQNAVPGPHQPMLGRFVQRCSSRSKSARAIFPTKKYRLRRQSGRASACAKLLRRDATGEGHACSSSAARRARTRSTSCVVEAMKLLRPIGTGAALRAPDRRERSRRRRAPLRRGGHRRRGARVHRRHGARPIATRRLVVAAPARRRSPSSTVVGKPAILDPVSVRRPTITRRSTRARSPTPARRDLLPQSDDVAGASSPTRCATLLDDRDARRDDGARRRARSAGPSAHVEIADAHARRCADAATESGLQMFRKPRHRASTSSASAASA